MQIDAIDPYSVWGNYGIAGYPALDSMRMRLSVYERETAAAAGNIANMLDYQRTADGWMQNIQDMAGRMAELAVAANDGTLNDVDRFALQAEFSQMQAGIRAITTGPYAMGKFNSLFLFQG